MNKHNIAWVVTILLIASVFVCSRITPSSEVKVLSGEYGDRWPWPAYSHAYLNCRNVLNDEVVTIKLGGITYGLNGPGQERYPDAREKMKRNSFGSPELGATFSIISRGGKICDEKAGD